jgi:hypothetical protein
MLYVRCIQLTKVKPIRDKHILSSERMLHKDYKSKGSFEKNISGREFQGAWRQDGLNGGKPRIVK